MHRDKLVNIFKTTCPNITKHYFYTFWVIYITKKVTRLKFQWGPNVALILYSPLHVCFNVSLSSDLICDICVNVTVVSTWIMKACTIALI